MAELEGHSDRQLSADDTNGPSPKIHELKQTKDTATEKEAADSSPADGTYAAGSKLALIVIALCASMFLVALVSLVAAVGCKSSRTCH